VKGEVIVFFLLVFLVLVVGEEEPFVVAVVVTSPPLSLSVMFISSILTRCVFTSPEPEQSCTSIILG
jgi:hypothetical protein